MEDIKLAASVTFWLSLLFVGGVGLIALLFWLSSVAPWALIGMIPIGIFLVTLLYVKLQR